MNRVRNDGMRSQMDGYNEIQRHKGRRERNGWVKLRVEKINGGMRPVCHLFLTTLK